MCLPTVNNSNESIVNQIITQANTDQLCLMLVSKNTSSKNVSFLFEKGINPKHIQLYRRELLSSDPHINSSTVALTSSSYYSNVIHLQDSSDSCLQKNSDNVSSAKKYRDYLLRNGISQTAIYSKQLTRSTFISVGLLSEKYRDRIKLAESENCIQEWIDIWSDELLSNGLHYQTMKKDDNETDKVSVASLLTARELDVTRNVCLGLSNKELAMELALSENTIENHLRNIYKKLSIHNRTSLVALVRDP